MSLACSNTDGPSGPYAAALAGMRPRSATVELAAVQAISLAREAHRYRWETVATVPLGAGGNSRNPARPVSSN